MTRLRRFILMTMSHLWWKQAAMSCQHGRVRRRATMAAITSSSAAMSCLHGPVRWRASVAVAEFSSHVIPTLACAAAWDLWLRHLGICPC